MENYILIAVLVLIIALAVGYVIRAKKKGVKCIGCPDSKTCSSNGCGGNCHGCQHNCNVMDK